MNEFLNLTFSDFSCDFVPDDSSIIAPVQTELSDQSITFLNSSYQLPQKLFDFFNSSITEDKSENVNQILEEISNYPAVQPLVPLYMRYFRKMLATNSLDNSLRMIQIINALLHNQTLNLDPYIQNFTSIVLTLYLSPNLICNDISQNHCLENVVSRYNSKEFKFKIAESLTNYVFSSSPSINSKYGALLGIQELGQEVFKLYLLPNLTHVLEDLENKLNDQSERYEIRFQVSKVKNLLFQMCVKAFNSEPQPIAKSMEEMYTNVAKYFGYDNFYIFAQFAQKK